MGEACEELFADVFVEVQALSDLWDFPDGSGANPAEAYRLINIQGEPIKDMIVLKRMLYAFEMIEVIEKIERLRPRADAYLVPPNDKLPKIERELAEARGRADVDAFDNDEAVYNAVQQDVLAILGEVSEFGLTEHRTLDEQSSGYTAENFSLLVALRNISEVQHQTFYKDDEYVAYMAERVARLMIVRKKGPKT